MAVAQETKVGGSGEAGNTPEFAHKFVSIWRRVMDDDSVMGVGNGRETDQLNENKDDQVIKTDCKVSDDGISAVSYTHLDVYKRQPIIKPK